MKLKAITFLSVFFFTQFVHSSTSNVTETMPNTIYQFQKNDINGDPFDFTLTKGKVVLIVNVASKCGFTGQYKGLEAIYRSYKDQGFMVIGVPSNNFGNQEPGSDAQIKSFCEVNYNVTFPILEKSIVKGEGITPLYQFLTDKTIHPKTGGGISWNFNKFLVDRSGFVRDRFSSFTKPDATKVVKKIESLLNDGGSNEDI